MAAARDVDHAFEDEHDLRAPGAAIGGGRRSVGDNSDAAHVRGRDVIDARRHRDAFGQWHKGNRTCAEIASVNRTQGEEVSVRIQGELRFRCQVAAVEIGQKGFAPLANPFDRPSDAFRRPGDQCELRAGVIADPEIPADIARHHAHRVFRHAERSGNVVPLADDPASGAGVHSESRGRLIVHTNGRPQFHRHASDAVDRRLQPHDMRGARARCVGRLLVTRRGVDAQIRAMLLPDGRRSGR